VPDSDPWDPEQYERFREERSLPFHDLLGLVQGRAGLQVVDLGCGTGELTRALHRRLKAARTLGLDRSEAMLDKSRAFADPGLSFARGDAAEFRAETPFDLVFSNAALHWVPDHPRLLEHLTAALAPGGQLAIQLPANHDQPSHRTAREVAREAPFVQALDGYSHPEAVLPVEGYARLLHELGYVRQHVRLQVYSHLLPGREAVCEWVKGTLLTVYRARLDPPLYVRFVERYCARLLPHLGEQRPFFFPFKRILLWGQRP